MSSPGQKRGACGHVMASFDSHAFCAHCRDKGKGKDPCVEQPDTKDCKFYNSLTPEQRLQLSTPSYKIKKEKWEAKKLESTPSKDTDTLVDLASVSVIWAVDDQGTVKSPSTVAPPEKKPKKEKPSTSKSTKPIGKKSDTDFKIAELDQKWSDRFNRLEALLLSSRLLPQHSFLALASLLHSIS